MKFSCHATIQGVDDFAQLVITKAPRTSLLAVRVMLDIVCHQGDSPAQIIGRVTGNRNNTGAESLISRFAEWGLVELTSPEKSTASKARRAVWLTEAGAELLGLKPL